MKLIPLFISALLLISSGVNATEWTLDNLEGGKIHLTEDKCANDSGQFFTFAYVRKGDRLEGCWTLRGTMVFVTWENGQRSAYPLDKFEQVDLKRLPGTVAK